MNDKISDIKEIILKSHHYDGEYWSNAGNGDIYKILDTFNTTEWNELKDDLITWKDYEHSIFSRAILDYDVDRIVDKVDVYEIFFTEFILQTDLDDADCQLQDFMYFEKIKNPSLKFLELVKNKITILSNYKLTTHKQESFKWAEQIVEGIILKQHQR